MNQFMSEVELRDLRTNVRRGVNALEVCWSCEVVCEASSARIGGRLIWLCGPCDEERRQRSEKVMGRALRAGTN